MRIRQAFTLIELMVVLSACAVVLTTSAALIHRVLHTQSAARSFFDIERSALRLSEHFRRDVHQANDATVGDASVDEGMFLRLRLPTGQIVEYRQSDAVVLRTLSEQESVVSREEFVFQPEIDLSIREEDAPRRMILTIVADPASVLATREKRPLLAHMIPVSLQIEGCLGRNTRLVKAAANRKKSE